MFTISIKSKTVPKRKSKVNNKYVCQCCGVSKSESNFYKSQWTKVWNVSGRHVLFCKNCIDKLMKEYTNRYGEQTALAICLALLDMPFYPTLYRSIIMNNSFFNIGLYIRLLNGKQYRFKCFADSIVEHQLSKSDEEVKKEVESKWSKTDKQNMKFAISVVGYDPFDNCGMTDNDRKYCFNILAGYCDDNSVQDDGHKIQCFIQITQSQLQCRKIDEMINSELLLANPDGARIKNFTDTKTKLLDSINATVNKNNLLADSKNNSKGKNTLSAKINELTKNGYEDMKVNLFDIKTCEAMRQVEDLSNKSIMSQVNLDSNASTEMLKEQRELLLDYENKADTLQEENRKLKNELLSLTSKKK